MALTLTELIDALIVFRDGASVADQPVLMLVDPDGDGLVADAQLDCFDEKQGVLVSLICERCCDASHG